LRLQSLFFNTIRYIKHGELWLNMLEMGFPPHLVQLLRNLYQGQKAAVRIAGAITEWFQVYKGVRQGCVLSPYLFNIVAEMVMREALSNFNGGMRIGGRLINSLRYADDTVLIATSVDDLQEQLNRIITSGRRFGLLLNKGKTKVMATDGNVLDIRADGELLEQVDSFTYLF